ncbi:hypothetical protein F9L16_02170 [Agarivorans sp. B2Z047]|uniref:hypothetical protein n=1 Tax=Agarivorans sp. B2Z047 TaxID=2652721 RepID=UPI00128C65C7|nr:hypothetical protein [Agarivorans sp. B2Z047]MPW27800.1 hypothetical protein [Agarivorans sp. B2Z047]UQN44365.1 hypothetical protein LQZ07_07795 [Agarivorans sp. B2Z047]
MINFELKDIETYSQIITSLATCFTVFVAYISIRQVKKIEKERGNNEQKLKTIEIVTEPNSGIAHLSSEPMAERKGFYPYLSWSLSDIDERLNLSMNGCSPKTIEMLSRQIRSRVPLCRPNHNGSAYIYDFNKTVIYKPFDPSSNLHRSYVFLFNKLEDVSSAINGGLLDVNLLNFMYGGMISTIYREHSEWLAWMKRYDGLRMFDQYDILIDHMLSLSSARYSLYKKRFLIKLLFCGCSGRKLLFLLVFSGAAYNRENTITKNALATELIKHNLGKDAEELINAAFLGKSKVVTLTAKKVRSSRFVKKKIYTLFSDCWKRSMGEWPVGMQSWSPTSTLNLSAFDDWFKYVSNEWEVIFYAKLPYWSRRQYAGMIALSYGQALTKNSKRWSLEIIEAARSHIGLNENVYEYLEKVGIPQLNEKGSSSINLNRMSHIQSFYTHSDIRNEYGFENIGRKLFRECVSYSRNQLGLIPFLSVIADSEFTQRAIELYVGEGGAYIGTTRDAGRADQHLVHVFIF